MNILRLFVKFNMAFLFKLHPKELRLRRNDHFRYIPQGGWAAEREGKKHKLHILKCVGDKYSK